MSDWEEQIHRILQDPGQMSKLSQLAQSLMGADAQTDKEPSAPPDLPNLSGLGALLGQSGAPDPALLGRLGRLLQNPQLRDNRQQALLEAMKPYLSEKRRSKMDRAMKLAHMAKLAQLAMGEAGGRNDV